MPYERRLRACVRSYTRTHVRILALYMRMHSQTLSDHVISTTVNSYLRSAVARSRTMSFGREHYSVVSTALFSLTVARVRLTTTGAREYVVPEKDASL